MFVGHYWLSAQRPELLADNVACLDFSVAKGGFLCAYRWNGERKLSNENFVGEQTRDRDEAMTTLAGKLIASPSPNRPGFWAYRQLESGTVLETELTKEEWFTLHNAATEEMNQRIDDLNARHPLNVAAIELIRRAEEYPGNPGSMHWLHILALASLGLADYEENPEPWEQFAFWTGGEDAMMKALHCLESAEIDPEYLRILDPADAARLILDELGIG